MPVTDLADERLVLDNQLCFALYAASRKVIQLYAPMLKELDLTYTQYLTMLALWQRSKLPVGELGDQLMLDTGTLTPLLKKLEAKGLVTRTRSKQDERSVLIELTEKGATLKQDALRLLPALLCSTQLDSSELVGLRERLKKLLVELAACA